ncbi:zinc metallochaperone AztD [Amycolatopsis sp. QT-25]|uniref:zinc metallochaperone AztD n=1 Tax=Amycolatopsis sp. QT-25 TaxID=3034022 RepID=UPI0023EE175A|nr:zinc metallochaperone AztD [Amycolatopsis sp. QT-25]WET76371.1 zinc metallochaperone AztD [Amycolatopsis sp. QT-25]
MARKTRYLALMATAASTLALAACGTEQPPAEAGKDPAPAPAPVVADPVAVTYDGGIVLLDGKTLKEAKNLPLEGFNRLNPAGNDRHLLVSTSTGFRVLDAVGAVLTDNEVKAAKPGHVVRHAGRTVLFADGTGEVTVFDPKTIGTAALPAPKHKTPEAHHGVAVELANGELLTTVGNADKRSGIVVLDKDKKEIARNEQCPGVHGEAAARGEAVVVGCQTGALIYRNGVITKVTSPDPYGRIGNQAGSDVSPITLGDYKVDEAAELERPTRISLIDTEKATLKHVDIGTSYTFRSLARGPQGEALVLGTDGQIHVIEPVSGAVTRKIPVLGTWQEPIEWQQPRPAIFVRGGTAYVTDPGKKEIHSIDLASGAKTATGTVPGTPNEVSGVLGH